MIRSIKIIFSKKIFLSVTIVSIVSASIQIIFLFSLDAFFVNEQTRNSRAWLLFLFFASSFFLWLSNLNVHVLSDRYVESSIQNQLNQIICVRTSEISAAAKVSTEVTRIIYNVAIPFYDSINKGLNLIAYLLFLIFSLQSKNIVNGTTLILFFAALGFTILIFYFLIKYYKRIGHYLAINHSARIEIAARLQDIAYLMKFPALARAVKVKFTGISKETTKLRSYQTAIISSVKPLVELLGIIFVGIIYITGLLDEGLIATLLLIGFRALPYTIQIISNLTNISSHLRSVNYLHSVSIETKTASTLTLPSKFSKLNGPSGSGKSTFLNDINEAGVYINDTLFKPSDIYLMKSNPIFLPGLTIDSLKVTPKISENEIFKGISTLLKNDIETLSTGEKVRVDYLRMCSLRIKVVLIDESLSNLNSALIDVLLNQLKNNTEIQHIVIVNHLPLETSVHFNNLEVNSL